MIEVLARATLVTILQYINVSNQLIVHLKLTQSYVSLISLKTTTTIHHHKNAILKVTSIWNLNTAIVTSNSSTKKGWQNFFFFSKLGSELDMRRFCVSDRVLMALFIPFLSPLCLLQVKTRTAKPMGRVCSVLSFHYTGVY